MALLCYKVSIAYFESTFTIILILLMRFLMFVLNPLPVNCKFFTSLFQP